MKRKRPPVRDSIRQTLTDGFFLLILLLLSVPVQQWRRRHNETDAPDG
jgi:hypothetical protein